MAIVETFIDSFAIQDSPKRLELVGRLRVLTQTSSGEVPDGDASKFLWAGAMLFNSNLSSWSEITPIQEHGIILWSAIQTLDALLFKWSRYFEIDSRVGKTKPNVRVENGIKLKAILMQQFRDYVSDSGLDLGDELVVGEWYRRDQVQNYDVPYDTRRTPEAVPLQVSAQGVGTFDVVWTKTEISDFMAYILYIDTNPNLEDKTRYGETDKCGVRSDVTEVSYVDKQHQSGLRVLVAAGTYWAVLALVTLNGRVALSNEVRIVVS